MSLDAELHMRIIYLIIGVLGMGGNALVALVILQTRSMRRTFPNMFIVHQSLLDFTASFLIIATTFISDINWVKTNLGKELFCRLWLTNLPLWGIFVSSTYNLVGLTYERYFAIVRPLRHSRTFTRPRIYVSFALAWLVGLGFNAAYMIPSSEMQGEECTVFTVWPSETWQKTTGIIIVVLQYFVPLVLIVYAYGRIAYTLKKAGQSHHRNEAGGKRQESSASANREDRLNRARKNVIKTLALVGVAFVFCWSWNQIYYIMYYLGFEVDFNSTFYHFTVVAVFCNCCLNPIIYSLKYDQFQRALKQVFCKAGAKDEELSLSSVRSTTVRTTSVNSQVSTEEIVPSIT